MLTYLLHSGTKAEMQQLEKHYISEDDIPAFVVCENNENIPPTKRKRPEGYYCIEKTMEQSLLY